MNDNPFHLFPDAELREDLAEDFVGGDEAGDGAEGGEGGAEVLRQEDGAFRLIRRADDKGVFVMLDAAAPTRLFSSLPEGVTLERVTLVEAIEATAAFLGASGTAPAAEA